MKTVILYISVMPADVSLNALKHNYMKLINAYVPEEILKSRVSILHIAHDDWCPIYHNGSCSCKPELTIEDGLSHQAVFMLRWR
jgi:hypothetical protein